MLCNIKLANLDFKSKKKNAKHNLLPFFFIINFEKKKQNQPQNEMHECYVMRILETKITKKNGHKGQSDET